MPNGRDGKGYFSVCFAAQHAVDMLGAWAQRFDPTDHYYKYYNWTKDNLKIYRLDMPAVNPFAKPRAWAWVLCYDLPLSGVWEPHIQGCTDNPVEITEAQLAVEAAYGSTNP